MRGSKHVKRLALTMVLAVILQTPVWADGTLYKIRTNRMDCDYCAYDVEQIFEKMEGIVDFEVDLDGVFLVKTAEGVKLTEPQVKKILLDAGFDYNGMTEESL